MKPKMLLIMGLVLLALAGVWKWALAPQWTQRLPLGWTWQAHYIGISTLPDPASAAFPAEDTPATYRRSARIIVEAERPQRVKIEDYYTIDDANTGQVAWQYLTTHTVNPLTGEQAAPEFHGQIFVFPRDVEQKTYTLRANYVEGIPLAYQGEEFIEGVQTYRFAYQGRGEYTRSYLGTTEYPGVPVKAGQEIRCSDDQFIFKIWVEPVSGEMLKMEESCWAGDYLYNPDSGQPVAAVSRWAGATAGDDVLIHAEQVRQLRSRLLWLDRYIPALLAVLGIALCMGAGVKPLWSAVRR